jgi:hypothetical protein
MSSQTTSANTEAAILARLIQSREEELSRGARVFVVDPFR